MCREWRMAVMRRSDEYWRSLCVALSKQAVLYQPSGPCPCAEGWSHHFHRLWEQRHTWVTSSLDDEAFERASAPPSFNVSVSVRFRPSVATAGGHEAAIGRAEDVTIPLHQKIAMVRAKRGCSHAQV